MTTITRRISGLISGASTKRVFTTDATPDIPPVFSNDSWGGSWGNAWGRTWFFASPLIPGTDTKPALDVTRRIDTPPQFANITKRLS